MAPIETGRSIVLLAQARSGHGELVLFGLLLGASLVAGAVAIALAGKWRRKQRDDRLTPSDQLNDFRILYEQGTISKEEYQRLRNLLGGQLRQELNIPVTAKPSLDSAAAANQPVPPPSAQDPTLPNDAPPSPPSTP